MHEKARNACPGAVAGKDASGASGGLCRGRQGAGPAIAAASAAPAAGSVPDVVGSGG